MAHSWVLAPCAVDHAADLCSCGHENGGSAAALVSMTRTVTGMRATATSITYKGGRRREDVAPGHWRAHQAGLHRWRPGLSSEFQRPVRSDEIVIAAQEVDVPAELVGATSVAGRSTAQVRRALANREVEALDERGVQSCGILRRQEGVLEPTRRADLHASLDPDDTIVPPSLEPLTIDARGPKEASDHPDVVLKAIGGDQRDSHEAPTVDDVADHGPSISGLSGFPTLFWGLSGFS